MNPYLHALDLTQSRRSSFRFQSTLNFAPTFLYAEYLLEILQLTAVTAPSFGLTQYPACDLPLHNSYFIISRITLNMTYQHITFIMHLPLRLNMTFIIIPFQLQSPDPAQINLQIAIPMRSPIIGSFHSANTINHHSSDPIQSESGIDIGNNRKSELADSVPITPIRLIGDHQSELFQGVFTFSTQTSDLIQIGIGYFQNLTSLNYSSTPHRQCEFTGPMQISKPTYVLIPVRSRCCEVNLNKISVLKAFLTYNLKLLPDLR